MIAAVVAIALAVGGTNKLTATCDYSDGSSKDCTALATWTNSAPKVVAVSGGVAKALASGIATVTATVNGMASNPVTLTVGTVTEGYLGNPKSQAAITQCGTTQFSAYAIMADGTVVANYPATWSTSNSSIGTVSSTGLFTAVSPGSVNVIATFATAAQPHQWTMKVSAGASSTKSLKPGTYTLTVSPCGSASITGVGVSVQ